MIYVNQEQLDQVEYIIEQSARGHHVLFDVETIRRAFDTDEADLHEPEPEIEKHIENLVLQPTLISKRAYLDRLERPIYHRVVRTYFSIIENNVFEGIKFRQ